MNCSHKLDGGQKRHIQPQKEILAQFLDALMNYSHKLDGGSPQ